MPPTVERGRTEAPSQLVLVERAHQQQLREALVEVGTHLGWDRQTVMRLSETITGRPWRQCGADDVLRVATVLLEVAAALRSACEPRAVVDGCDCRPRISPALDIHAGSNHFD